MIPILGVCDECTERRRVDELECENSALRANSEEILATSLQVLDRAQRAEAELARLKETAERERDILADRYWIIGAQAGWNFGTVDDRAGLNAAIEQRSREIAQEAKQGKGREA
ncbi:MAG: hypothetical protein ABFD89_00685 [Bryobacteraceae bacterium]